MLILGIKSSCDETSIAVVRDGKRYYQTTYLQQIEIHKQYGAVIPEIASRQHIKKYCGRFWTKVLHRQVTLDDIDYIAVTMHRDSIGALLVGVSFAKGLSYGHNIPLVPVHHIKGHIYANFAEHDVKLPCIALVVSGGHTNIIHIDENHKFTNLGDSTTLWEKLWIKLPE